MINIATPSHPDDSSGCCCCRRNQVRPEPRRHRDRPTVKNTAENELLSTKEFAARAHLPETMVQQLRRTGRLAYNKIGRRVLIPASEIERLKAESFRPARRPLQHRDY
ncbi:MAG: helix-turn-helix domain-containing protein [Actinomycetales bacterium]|nr:helix-turn-helix domain-containing protein [Actinomycetales bacterium]